ncbi:hypothetical protein BE1S18E01_21390 [Acinetobacter sp. BEC1-S18-ESBL-01]|jgi:hypothetical protein|nr:hypothetical protein C2U64_13395 [Acinetobacter pittii]ENW12501.1 hypothetical protein F930_02457 [Acinetobacter pittii ANC 3678]ENW15867.1 hypothetical protein F928_00575 [Acinetobacter pittii ATCC 19004 = CIP 70.29]OYP79114.1 hypothetical protein CIL08_02460 [Acinetobacter sp. BS1]BBU18611.1 hypothetical protein BE1S18E01_21390 [Acinetobacter sp. BEC1-S18-ESBL-01]
MANICSFLFVQLPVLVLRKGALIHLYLLIKTTKVMAVNKVIYSDCSTVVFLCYCRRVIRDLYLA